jgi:hypothetical protein
VILALDGWIATPGSWRLHAAWEAHGKLRFTIVPEIGLLV